jgi:transcriptional regulator with XRE-family HTH domain
MEAIVNTLKSTDSARSATNVDAHVGAHLKAMRIQQGLTQGDLAKALGISFQQLQKYERGVNRLSASRLYDLANVLKVEIGAFYSGLPLLAGASLCELQEAAK